jgi:hypothetical protein
MLVFGGLDGGASGEDFGLVNDVWSLSLNGAPAWSRLEVVGAAPTARSSARAIYDPAGDRMIVFGGRDAARVRDDVWALSLGDAPSWTELTPAQPGPVARAAHGLVYDSDRRRMLVFGGTDETRLLDDTWALSLVGAPTWSRIPVDAPQTLRRRYPSAVYDPRGERLVVWGGSHGGVPLNDTWTLSLADPPRWTQATAPNAAPEPREGHSGIYDPKGRRLVIFGGDYDMNDTWALSLDEPRRRAPVAEEVLSSVNAVALDLRDPRPNPFAGETEVEFTLPQPGQVSVAVYDAAGRNVRRLAEGPYAPGVHGLRWDGRDSEGHPAPTGLYFMRLESGGKAITKKTVISR